MHKTNRELKQLSYTKHSQFKITEEGARVIAHLAKCVPHKPKELSLIFGIDI